MEKQLIPQLRFSQFDGEWKSVKIGDLTTVTAGGTPSTLKKEYWNGNIPWMNSGELNLKRVYDVQNRITELGLKKSSTKIIPINSVLIGLAGQGKTRGTAAINLIELCINQSIAAIYPNNNLFHSEFLYHNIDNRYEELRNLSTGAGGRGGLNLSIIKSFQIPIPSLPEQQKIASFLSDVDAKITQLTKKKALLAQYKKGVMQKIFNQELRFKDDNGNCFPNWEEKSLKQLLISFKLGGNYSNSDKITDRPLIKMGNLGRGNILTNKVQYIDDSEVVDEDDQIKKGDLFFNTRNTLDLVGKVAIWRDELPLAYYNSNLMRFEFNNNYFMNYRLNSYDGIKGLKRYATGTTSVAAIYTKDLLKLKLSIPSIEEQTKIANFLSDIDIKIEALTTQIENSKAFKKGLLQQMFV